MYLINKATKLDLTAIQEIAYITWPITYGSILSSEQLKYMLGLFFSEKELAQNMIEKEYLVYREEDTILGFLSFEHNYKNNATSRINRLYVLPLNQGKGIGKKMLDFVEVLAKKQGSQKLSLNVNRYNNALFFYEKLGFKIVAEVDIEIGNGYLMEDFVLEKVID